MTEENYGSSHPTVQISAKRFQQSPFLEKYQTPGMVFGVYAHRFYPLRAEGDPVEDYWHLRRQVMLFDVPERPIEIRGPDGLKLLEKVNQLLPLGVIHDAGHTLSFEVLPHSARLGRH